MKKISSILLGLSLALGTVAMAQDTMKKDSTDTTTKKKKSSKKKKDTDTTEKKGGAR